MICRPFPATGWLPLRLKKNAQVWWDMKLKLWEAAPEKDRVAVSPAL